MNPHPCGFLSDPSGKCTCTAPQIQKYRAKISGPLLDRIDLQIDVPKVAFKELSSTSATTSSKQMKERVQKARTIQENRLKRTKINFNALMDNRHMSRYCKMDKEGEKLLEKAVDTLGFSARACHSIIRVARTIADLDESEHIKNFHIAEAIGFRSFDRNIV